jgi:hypothetical protein
VEVKGNIWVILGNIDGRLLEKLKNCHQNAGKVSENVPRREFMQCLLNGFAPRRSHFKNHSGLAAMDAGVEPVPTIPVEAGVNAPVLDLIA